MQETYIQFDRAKLKSAVHYICSQMAPSELGNVKLHKILYFADMLKFADCGQPLTGVDYIKQQFGPTARHLTAVLTELSQDGAIQVRITSCHGYEKKEFVSLVELDRSQLGNLDIEILDETIEFARNRSASILSELSHDAAWHMALIGERIPYAAVNGWQPAEFTDKDLDAAIAEARQIRPQIERERREKNRVL